MMSNSSPTIPAVGLAASLEKEDRDTLASYGHFHIAKQGSVLIEQGKPHGCLFFVIEGLFHARREDDGQDVLLGRINPGDWIGEVDLFDPSNAICSVVAMEPSQYWVITRDELEAFINNYQTPGTMLLIGLASTLGRRIRAVTAKLSEERELARIRQSLFEVPGEAPPTAGG